MSKPLSAITESPCYRYSKKPLCSVMAWAEIEPSNTLDMNVTCPCGAIPIRTLTVL